MPLATAIYIVCCVRAIRVIKHCHYRLNGLRQAWRQTTVIWDVVAYYQTIMLRRCWCCSDDYQCRSTWDNVYRIKPVPPGNTIIEHEQHVSECRQCRKQFMVRTVCVKWQINCSNICRNTSHRLTLNLNVWAIDRWLIDNLQPTTRRRALENDVKMDRLPRLITVKGATIGSFCEGINFAARILATTMMNHVFAKDRHWSPALWLYADQWL